LVSGPGVVIPFTPVPAGSTTVGAAAMPDFDGLKNPSLVRNVKISLVNASSGITYTYAFNPLTGQWTGCTVPLKLYDFVYSKSNCVNSLSWKIAESSQMDYYVVERAGSDRVYKRIKQGTITNSITPVNYFVTDNYPLKDNNIYRIRAVDIFGQSTYSYYADANQVEIPLNNTACSGSQPAPVFCSSTSISGPTGMCTDMQEYKIINLPDYSAGATNWTVTPNDGTRVTYVNGSANGYDRITLGKSGIGEVLLNASVQGCTNSLSKTIQVGAEPGAFYRRNGGTPTWVNLNNPVQGGSFRIDLECSTCTNVQWTRTAGTASYYTAGTSLFFDLNAGSVSFRVTGTSACGSFSRTYAFYKVGGTFSASPNPSAGMVDLVAKEAEKIFSVKVLDVLGRVYFNREYPGGIPRTQLNLQHLKADTYLLQISNGKSVTVQQLVLNNK
jgi:Secretion system C-terminal sorting domain